MKCIGAILGDVVGSRFEHTKVRNFDFEFLNEESHFTDDTVMTIATMDYLLHQRYDVAHYYKKWAKRYPNAGYGYLFYHWALLDKDSKPYNSYGNGGAMRVSPVAYAAKSLEEAEKLAEITASCTHNHPEGIKGAVTIAGLTYLAYTTHNKEKMVAYALKKYPDLANMDIEKLVRTYDFDVTSQGSVPVAIYLFLLSNSYEDAIRKVMFVGGDTDTIGAMTGAISEAFYGIPTKLEKKLYDYLPGYFIEIIKSFNQKFISSNNK